MMRGVPGMDYDIEKLKMTIDDHNGIATSLQLQKEGFSRLMLYDALLKGIVRKESHGNYYNPDHEPDRFCALQNRTKKLVFSHLSALYLQGICPDLPSVMDLTVSQGDNISRIKKDFENTRFHYCKKEVWEIGRKKVLTPKGFSVFAYETERSICEAIRERDAMEEALYLKTLQSFFQGTYDQEKFAHYSKLLHVEQMVDVYKAVFASLNK